MLAKNDYKMIEPVRKLFAKSGNPAARLHAAATLSALGSHPVAADVEHQKTKMPAPEFKEDLMKEMLIADRHPAVRALGVAFGKGDWLLHSSRERLLSDPDPRVCMQLAYSLGESSSPQAGEFLGRLFTDHQKDRYITAAVLSSVHAKNWSSFFTTVLRKNAVTADVQLNVIKLVTALGNADDKVNFLLNWIEDHKGKSRQEELAMLASLLENFTIAKSSLAEWSLASQDAGKQARLAKFTELMRTARTVLADPKAASDEKILAIQVLGRDPTRWEEDGKQLTPLLLPQVEERLQMAAVHSLGKMMDMRTPGLLLKPWKGYSPTVRMEVLKIVLSRPAWTRTLMDALESKGVLATELDTVRRQQLLQHQDADIRHRAEKLMAAASDANRSKVVMHYVGAVPTQGNADLGKKIFAKHCAACHQLAGVGQQVGPDLASVPDKSLEGLLTAILDPNRVVEARYVNYLAVTKSGLHLSGVLFGETSTTITLVAADGKKHEMLRQDLDELASTGKSPMPEGFEKEIPPRDMADLIAFLRAGLTSASPKAFAGNRPDLVKPDDKGVLKLLPQNGAIFGKTLILEQQYGNLGHWSSADDHAVWALDVPAAGVYAVELEWACADDSSGNVFSLQAGAKKLTHKVAGTGTWDDYKLIWFGTIELPQGRVEVSMRAQTPLRGALD